MAFGTKNVWITPDVVADFAPVGHSVATARVNIGTIDIPNQQLTVNTILASASVNANKVTAFDDLMNTELVTFLDNAVDVTKGVDVTGNTVDYNFTVTSVSRGLVANDVLLDSATDVFVIIGVLEIAIS